MLFFDESNVKLQTGQHFSGFVKRLQRHLRETLHALPAFPFIGDNSEVLLRAVPARNDERPLLPSAADVPNGPLKNENFQELTP